MAEKKEEFKYGVSDLAEELGLAEASVRVGLRSIGAEKEGNRYGWNKESDFKAVLKELQARSAKKPDMTPKEGGKKKKKKKKK